MTRFFGLVRPWCDLDHDGEAHHALAGHERCDPTQIRRGSRRVPKLWRNRHTGPHLPDARRALRRRLLWEMAIELASGMVARVSPLASSTRLRRTPTLPLNYAGCRRAPAFAVYDVEFLTTRPPPAASCEWSGNARAQGLYAGAGAWASSSSVSGHARVDGRSTVR